MLSAASQLDAVDADGVLEAEGREGPMSGSERTVCKALVWVSMAHMKPL